MSATKAAAKRWLADKVGTSIDTVQTRPDGSASWRPGVRTLTREGNAFLLDGSRVSITTNDVVLEVTENSLKLEWQDEDGVTIHVTEYTVSG